MASLKSPGRKARPHEHVHDIGNVGRRTGITLEPRIRDEYGLENPEGLFSPTPGKPLVARETLENGKLDSSDEMDIAHSSAPEPTEVLTGRRAARDGKSMLPIPLMRSPKKTSGISGTPRRGSSIGIASASPSRTAPPGSEVGASQNSVKRRLIFNGAGDRSSPYSNSGNSRRDAIRAPGASRLSNNVYDYPTSPEPEDEAPALETFDDQDMGVGGEDAWDSDGSNGAGGYDHGGQPLDDIEEEVPQEVSDLADKDHQPSADVSSTIQLPQGAVKRKRGRPRREPVVEAATLPGDAPVEESPDSEPESEPGPEIDEAVPESEPEADVEMPPPKRRGRPPRADKAKAPALKSKSTNARLKSGAKPDKGKGRATTEQRVPFQAQRQRHQTPTEEDGVFHTRFGRNVYKPLSYWKGEHAILEERRTQELPGVVEIIRVDEPTPVKRKRSYYRPKKQQGNNKRAYSVFEDEIEDAGQEPWETDEGAIFAPVNVWDADIEMTVPDADEQQQIAFAAAKMLPHPTPDNPNFRFTKAIRTRFFGGGVIEVPPAGSKGLKNSRRFQFIFFVHSGKVAVEVAGTRFVISKGGMWQVPRGNFYSITNETEHPAKIFFSQGCETMVEPEDVEPTQAEEEEVEIVTDDE